jgi:predicted MFS family arabinose efflux permease
MLVLPPLINWLLSAYDWRSTFIVLTIIIFIISVLSVVLLRRDPGQLGLKPYGADETGADGQVRESRSFSLKEAALTREFWLFCMVLFGYGFCFFSLQVHIAPYVTDRGISSTVASTIMAVIGGASIVGQAGIGSLGDKLGYKRTFLVGLIFIVLAIVTLIAANSLWTFFLFAIILGLAFGNCGTQESPIAAWLFGLGSHGIILGFFAFSFTIGSAIGPLMFGYLYDSTGSYQTAFWIAGIVAVAAVILMFFVKKSAPKTSLGTKTTN